MMYDVQLVVMFSLYYVVVILIFIAFENFYDFFNVLVINCIRLCVSVISHFQIPRSVSGCVLFS